MAVAGAARVSGAEIDLSDEQHRSRHRGHAEVFEQGDGGERDFQHGAHAGAFQIEALAQGIEDAQGAEDHDDDGRGL